MNRKPNYLKITASVILCTLVGFLSMLAMQSSLDLWLDNIKRPVFLVSDIVFSTCWLVNFALMGFAAGMVWSRGLHHSWVKTAMYHFGFQLLLTAAWFIVFFEMKLPFMGFLLTTALFILLLFTIRWFKVVKPLAAYLLIPYTIWIAYTALVNFQIWRLN